MNLKRTNYSLDAPIEEIDKCSRIVKTGPFVFCGGTTSVLPDGTVVAEGDSYGQVKYILEKLLSLMVQANVVKEDIYSVKIYATPDFDERKGLLAYEEIFSKVKPILTCVTIEKLTRPEQIVEIEVNAIAGSDKGIIWNGINMERTNISFVDGKIDGMYSASALVKIGPFIYMGGRGLSQTISFRKNDTIAQNDTILSNEWELLLDAGANRNDIIKMKKYVTEDVDIEELEMKSRNPVDHNKQATSIVKVERLSLREQEVEIELFAIAGSGGHKKHSDWGNIDFRKEIISAPTKERTTFVKSGPFVYSGLQYPVDADENMVSSHNSKRQESVIIEEFSKTLEKFNVLPNEVIKFKRYYTSEFRTNYKEEFTSAYELLYKSVKPLYTGVVVSNTGRKDAVIAMEIMAVKGC